jgi:hypothetical protein
LNNFKARMGTSENPTISFELDDFNFPSINMDSSIKPFSPSEIDKVIQLIPMDKSLGSDDFNARFLKKCWHIIKEDFYQLFQDFHSGLVSL